MKTLLARNCALEPLVAAHAPAMFDVLGDPAIYEFENEPPQSVEWLARRYRYLEMRGPPDGSQKWLNWVVRLRGGALAGYVQATVVPTGVAYVAYELNSRHWRKGIGSEAVRAMLEELHAAHGVHTFIAVFKAANFRSRGLLRHLGFMPASPEQLEQYRDEPDEEVMVKQAGLREHAALSDSPTGIG
jgi:[ribosomal protein S5]-alanine N-acetyltransferase